MARPITINEYLQQRSELLLIDVRSPGEFARGHIPGALSLPLFSDVERSAVGTAYKQESRQKAIKLGLRFFGPKMVAMVEQVEAWLPDKPSQGVAVHCWRGGMRSAGVAWLLELYGIKVYTIQGGYKSWRRWCVAQFEKKRAMQIVGGLTGSRKTELLSALQHLGQPILDLEAIASHRGSAFGNIGMPPQPTQEMFENRLAEALLALDDGQAIWVEDESQRIGCVNLPHPFYLQMKSAPVFKVHVPFEARLAHIINIYGGASKDVLINAVDRIKKRLGGLEASNAKNSLEAGETEAAFRILLGYYDKFYQRSMLHNRGNAAPAAQVDWDGREDLAAAKQLVAMAASVNKLD